MTFQCLSYPIRRHDRRAGSGSALFVCVLLSLFVMPVGCASSDRQSPYAAFDELAHRSLSGDIAYVKQHLAPELVDALQSEASTATDPAVDLEQSIGALMNRLQRFRCLTPDRQLAGSDVEIEAYGTDPHSDPGGLVRCKYRLRYGGRRGWLLVSRSYDVEPFVKTEDR